MTNTKKNGVYHILRVSMAITFLWIGVLILQDPAGWSGFVQPYVADLLGPDLVPHMIATAILDIAVGFVLLIDVYTWIAALVAAIHLAIVLLVSGIDGVTVRDIGLLGGAVAIFWGDLPMKHKKKVEGMKGKIRRARLIERLTDARNCVSFEAEVTDHGDGNICDDRANRGSRAPLRNSQRSGV